MRPWLFSAVAVLVVMSTSTPGGVSSHPCRPWPDGVSAECRTRIARYFAPILKQNVSDDRRDFITNVDFDDNWDPEDQKAHVVDSRFPLRAHVYFSVVGGRRHFFIGYGFYHPVDYKFFGPHENDFEGALLVVDRPTSEGWGDLLAVETLAHDQIYQYRAHVDVQGREQDIDRNAVVDEERDASGAIVGRHATLVAEARGHGVYGFGSTSVGSRVITYYPGDTAQEPDFSRARTTYALVSMVDTKLWSDRLSASLYRDGFGHWNGTGYESNAASRLLGEFLGESSTSMARPPWAWNDNNDGIVQRGDWFLAPAFAYAHHLRVPHLVDADLALANYYDANPFFAGGAGSNPPFSSAADLVPAAVGPAQTRRGETAFVIAGDDLKKLAAPGAAPRSTPSGDALRTGNVGVASAETIRTVTLEVALKRRTFIVLRYVNPAGAPAARVAYGYGPASASAAVVRGVRLVLLPELPTAAQGQPGGAVVDQARELLIELDEASGPQVLRELSVTFTDRLDDASASNAVAEETLPDSLRAQLRRFRATPGERRSVDLLGVSIVTTNEGAGEGR